MSSVNDDCVWVAMLISGLLRLQAEQASVLCDWVLALLRDYSASHRGHTGVQVHWLWF